MAILIFVGTVIYRDYGISTDEPVNRANGAVSARYVVDKINQSLGTELFAHDEQLNGVPQRLDTYHDRDYGVAFDLPLYLLERALQINEPRQQYLFRHLATYSVFLLGIAALFLVVDLRYSDWRYGFCAVCMVVLSPRIFAEGFYNIKDIVFMSFVSIGLLTLALCLRRMSVGRIVAHAAVTAIAIDIRIVALTLIATTLVSVFLQGIAGRKKTGDWLSPLLLYLALTSAFVCMLWPWLWSDPVGHFFEALRNMSRFRWDGWIRFNGHYYPAGNLPRSYLFMWMAITIPLAYSALALTGIARVLIGGLRDNIGTFKSQGAIFDISVLMLLAAPMIAVIALRPVIYDGWRQFYFLYPLVVYMAVAGLNGILSWTADRKFVSAAVLSLLLIQFALVGRWMYVAHPYQNVYFNALAGSDWDTNYETDYWGLTNVEGLLQILDRDNRSEIRIWSLGHTSVNAARYFLTDRGSERLKVVDSMKDADYVIYNHRDVHPAAGEIYRQLRQSAPVFYRIDVDGRPIFTIFKMPKG